MLINLLAWRESHYRTRINWLVAAWLVALAVLLLSCAWALVLHAGSGFAESRGRSAELPLLQHELWLAQHALDEARVAQTERLDARRQQFLLADVLSLLQQGSSIQFNVQSIQWLQGYLQVSASASAAPGLQALTEQIAIMSAQTVLLKHMQLVGSDVHFTLEGALIEGHARTDQSLVCEAGSC